MVALKDFSWERMIAAVEDVRERAVRAARALQQAGIPHVVVGGNAVAAWVARVDREAVRNTKDVDLLVTRQDFARIIAELQAVGFIHQNVAGRRFVPGRAARFGAKCDSCLVCRGEGAAGRSSPGSRNQRVRARARLSRPYAGGLGSHETDLVPPERPGPPHGPAGSGIDRFLVGRPFPCPACCAANATHRDPRARSVKSSHEISMGQSVDTMNIGQDMDETVRKVELVHEQDSGGKCW